jgi:hypothetical protein
VSLVRLGAGLTDPGSRTRRNTVNNPEACGPETPTEERSIGGPIEYCSRDFSHRSVSSSFVFVAVKHPFRETKRFGSDLHSF